MSKFLHNGPCDRCGSRNNLATYDDGSQWCWGCHFYSAPIGISLNSVRDRLVGNIKSSSPATQLPRDSSPHIPGAPLEWIKKYGLTNDEIREAGFLYSEEKQQLIYPVYDADGVCIFWQGRTFDPKQERKYDTKGNQKDVLVLLGTGDTCVVVEDVVSAIKVARHTTATPLFGSHIDLQTVLRLCKRYKSLTIWLDPDKIKEAVKFSHKYGPYFKDGCRAVMSDKDPKDHSDSEIQNAVTSL